MDGKKHSLSILLGLPKKVADEDAECEVSEEAVESVKALRLALKSGTDEQVAQALKVVFTDLMDME